MKRSVRTPSHFRVGDILEIVNGFTSFRITKIESDRIWFAAVERRARAGYDTYEEVRGGSWSSYEFKKQFIDYYDEIKDIKTTSEAP